MSDERHDQKSEDPRMAAIATSHASDDAPDPFGELGPVAELEHASALYKKCAEEENYAVNRAADALNNVIAAQRRFDRYVTEVRFAHRHGDWQYAEAVTMPEPGGDAAEF